jgi:hypothetical protein
MWAIPILHVLIFEVKKFGNRPTNQEYLNDGWLGRYLDLQCKEHQPTAGINIDSIDNLALKGEEPNSITVKDPNRFVTKTNWKMTASYRITHS